MSIDELFRDGRAIDTAIKRAVRRAVAENNRHTHARIVNPKASFAERKNLSVSELFRDGRAIDTAIKRAVRRAVAKLDRENAAAAGAKKKDKGKGKALPLPLPLGGIGKRPPRMTRMSTDGRALVVM